MSEPLQITPFWGCMIPLKYPQMERAVRIVMGNLGIELQDDSRFSCCPDPIYFKAGDRIRWMTLAARNICLAEERGLDLVTMCSGCTATLCEVDHHLKTDPELRDRINANLKDVGMEYQGRIRVRHLVTLLRDEVGLDVISGSVVHPLEDVKVAIHYGCHLLKPSAVMQVEDPLTPSIMAQLIAATGAVPIEHHEYLMCCGKACNEADLALNMSHAVFDSTERSGADCLGLICPTCFDSFDVGQLRVSRHFDKSFRIPVVYYFQLLAIAQGADPKDVGIQYHKIMTDGLLEKLNAVPA